MSKAGGTAKSWSAAAASNARINKLAQPKPAPRDPKTIPSPPNAPPKASKGAIPVSYASSTNQKPEQPVPTSTQSQQSSWAKVAAKPAAKKPNPAPQKVPTPANTPAPPVQPTLPTVHLYDIRPAESALGRWETLPSDVLKHHLYPALKHNTRSITAVRQTCRAWYHGILLPSVVTLQCDPLPSFEHFVVAAKHCEQLHITRGYSKLREEYRRSLTGSHNLRSLVIESYATPDDNLGKIVISSSNLRHVALTDFGPTHAIMKWLKLLQSISSRLQSLELTIHGSLSRDHTCVKFLQGLPITKLCLLNFKLNKAMDAVMQTFLASSTKLEHLSLCEVLGISRIDYSIILEGIKRNKSVKTLVWQQTDRRADLLYHVVSNHPSIEHMDLGISYFDMADALIFYSSSQNLKSFDIHRYATPPSDDDELAAQAWLECISKGKTFNGADIATIARSCGPKLKEVAALLKKDPSFKNLRLATSDGSAFGISDPAFDFGSMLLGSNTYIEVLEIPHISHERSGPIVQLCKGLAEAKALKTFRLSYSPGNLNSSCLETLLTALGNIPTLEELHITGPLSVSAATHISGAILKHGRLGFIELIDSGLGQSGVETLLNAAAAAKCLRVLHLPLANVKETDTPFNTALAACLRECNIESLSFFRNALKEGAINTIVSALRQRQDSPLKYLDLQGINIDPIVQRNVDDFLRERAGHVLFNRTFEMDASLQAKEAQISGLYQL